MSNGAHDAIDARIAVNEVNPKNIKNKVNSNTVDIYDLLESSSRVTGIYKGETEGGEPRFYKRDFYKHHVPSSYYDGSGNPELLQQLYANAIMSEPQDTTSRKDISDTYKLFGKPNPFSTRPPIEAEARYDKGGEVSDGGETLQQMQDTLFDKRYKSLLELQSSLDEPYNIDPDLGVTDPEYQAREKTKDKIEIINKLLREEESWNAKQRYKELMGHYKKAGFTQPKNFRDLIHFFEGYAPGKAAEGHPLNVLRTSDTYLADVYERMLRNK